MAARTHARFGRCRGGRDAGRVQPIRICEARGEPGLSEEVCARGLKQTAPSPTRYGWPSAHTEEARGPALSLDLQVGRTVCAELVDCRRGVAITGQQHVALLVEARDVVAAAVPAELRHLVRALALEVEHVRLPVRAEHPSKDVVLRAIEWLMVFEEHRHERPPILEH